MFFQKVANNQSNESLATNMRRKRFAFFMELLSTVQRPLTILDVGGTQGFWERMGFVEVPNVSITVLNVTSQPVSYHNFTSTLGDATNLAMFEEDDFDVVFSNSVIEHVGNREAQIRMAREVQRVGKRYFVQTPNYYFPIEPHFLFPGFQWLPLETRAWMLHHFDLGWSKRTTTREQAYTQVGSVELLRKEEFLDLFPGAKLYTERVLGLIKSFVVYSGW